MMKQENSHGSGRWINPNHEKQRKDGTAGYYPSMLRICGRTFHQILNSAASHNQFNNGLNWYVYDASAAHQAPSNPTHQVHKPKDARPEDVDAVRAFLIALNPFAAKLKQMGELSHMTANTKVELKWKRDDPYFLTALIANTTDLQTSKRSICIWPNKSPAPQPVDILSPFYEPLQYPMFYPTATAGWYCDMTAGRFQPRKPLSQTGLLLSQLDYYKRLLMKEPQQIRLYDVSSSNGKVPKQCHLAPGQRQYAPLRFGQLGVLFNEWAIDMFSRMEDEKLSFVRHGWKPQQQAKRSEVERHGKASGRVKLPNSHVGSTRWKRVQLANAWSILTELGVPTLFITFTCNPKWPEILEHLKPGQTAADRPDIVSRVFKLKLDALKKRLREKWGLRIYEIGVIEYQDRGYPHAHIVTKLTQNSMSPGEIDQYVQAYLPPHTRSRCRELVKTHMAHSCSNCKKTKEGHCYYKYGPNGKDICAETHIVNEDGHVAYKRPTEQDRWVVPTNWDLIEEFQCHINVTPCPVDNPSIMPRVQVEICYTRNVMKYLFKYLHKGSPSVQLRCCYA